MERKNSITIIIIVLFFNLVGCGKPVKYASVDEDRAAKTFTSSENVGVVYIFHKYQYNTRMSRAILSLDNRPIGYIKADSFIRLEIGEGTHDLRTLFDDIWVGTKISMVGHKRLEIKKGNIYYLELKHCATWTKAGFCFHDTNQKEAQTKISSCELVEQETIDYIAPKLFN